MRTVHQNCCIWPGTVPVSCEVLCLPVYLLLCRYLFHDACSKCCEGVYTEEILLQFRRNSRYLRGSHLGDSWGWTDVPTRSLAYAYVQVVIWNW